MKYLSLFLLAGALSFSASAQNLVSIQQNGTIPASLANLILAQYNLTAQNDITHYTLRYTMQNLEGRMDTVSGLLVVPSGGNVNNRYPRLVYQHGTTVDKYAVPSRENPGQDLPYFYASQGYVTLAPDYLNMGDDQDGFHPYVHAETEALAAIRMLQALEASPAYANLVNRDQLFLTGYSQGGHASMALHEMLLEEFPNIAVTAAAHMSGPYSISDVMLNDVILKDSTFAYLGFLPYTVLAYQEAYAGLDRDLNEIFRGPYVADIAAFRDGYETGAVGLDVLTNQLLQTYVQTEGNSTFYPSRLLTPAFKDQLLNNPSNPYRQALYDNDTYRFVNPTPTRLYYCRADDQVSYLNSIVAADTLNQLGATNTMAVNVDNDADHSGCIFPAVLAALDFFEDYKRIVSGTGEIPASAAWSWLQQANELRIYADPQEQYTVEVMDGLGRRLLRQPYRAGEAIALGNFPRGWIAVRVVDQEGRTVSKPLVLH